MKKKLIIALSASMLAMVSLAGCTPVGIAASVGTAAGKAAASEGGIPRTLTDTRIRADINDRWLKADLEMFRKVNLAVNNARVLLTGVVQKPEHRIEAVRKVWQVDGVKEVINEIKVANSEGIEGFVRDNWITGSIKTKLLFDRDVQSINYTVDTVQSVVYLMGVSQNQRELNKVIYHARNTDYVRNVVPYTRMLGQPLPAAQPLVQEKQQPSNTYTKTPSRSDIDAQPLPPPSSGVLNPAATSGRPAPILDKGF